MPIKSDYFGKYCEYKIFAELLKQHFDVFTTILDNKGIDCIVKNGNEYFDIQIKGRQPRWRYNLGNTTARDNYFFIFITPPAEAKKNNSEIIPQAKTYILPSKVAWQLADRKGRLTFSRREAVREALLSQYEFKEGVQLQTLLH